MVCQCCKIVVAKELKKLNLLYSSLELGEVRLTKSITINQRTQLSNVLDVYGLMLMENVDAILVEKIVVIIVTMIYETRSAPSLNLSEFLSRRLKKEYKYLSLLFSKTKGVTIEQFIILHKIERVKELIAYDELSLTEISYQLHYSNVAHLSNQFKKVTGLTPSFFKKNKNRKLLKKI
jgi:AraC-like DNA-binding protein